MAVGNGADASGDLEGVVARLRRFDEVVGQRVDEDALAGLSGDDLDAIVGGTDAGLDGGAARRPLEVGRWNGEVGLGISSHPGR